MMAPETVRKLKLDVEQVGSAAVVRISGSAGMTEAENMRLKLEELVERKIPLIVLDLGEMDFICSQALGVMISMHVSSRQHNGRLGLVNPQPAVRQLLEITRLTKLFEIYPTVEQALAT